MSKENYAEVASEIASLAPDVIVVTAFGIIIKEDLLDLPRYGCVNVHASLLPKYRGVSPIQEALLAGDEETGCTTMKMDAGIDTGDILMKESLVIRAEDNAGILSERLSRLGAELLVRTLDGLWDGTVVGTAQDDSLSSYTKKIKKTDGEINWSLDAAVLVRRVRAMTPWPSAYTFRDGRRLIIVEAIEASGADVDADTHAGNVLRVDPLTVVCGRGGLVIRRLKPEGRQVMSTESYLTGHPLEIGDKFG
jgi:methionyl-tRNA formyltransferase